MLRDDGESCANDKIPILSFYKYFKGVQISCQFRMSSCDLSFLPVLLGATGSEGSEPGHEEVETGEGDHVDRQLPQVSIELAGEPEACSHTWNK